MEQKSPLTIRRSGIPHDYNVSMSSDSKYFVTWTNGNGGRHSENYIFITKLPNEDNVEISDDVFKSYNLYANYIIDAKLSPDNKYLVAVDKTAQTYIWDVDNILNIKKDEGGRGRHTKRRKSKKAKRTRRKF
jgi:hypothetical protein